VLIQPDLLVRDAILEGLVFLRQNQAPLREIFQDRPETELSDVTEFFATRLVKVELGFPAAPGEVPGIYVSIKSAQEVDPPIGMAMDIDDETVLRITENRGTFFQTTVSSGCWSESRLLTVWLQNVVTWALLQSRDRLSAKNLYEQRLGCGDLQPYQQFFPDITYYRDVTLSTKHPQVVTEDFYRLAEIDVTAKATGFDTQTVRISRRP
jgi:hypothetical protein